MAEKKYKTTALVLGGGSARGFAHIGVLEVLQKAGIKFDFVVGTSIGSLLGAYYTLGLPLEEAEWLAKNVRLKDMTDVTIPQWGINKGDKLYQIVREALKNKSFQDLVTPFVVVTTDLETGESVLFREGDLIKAVQASCSIPGIFSPVRIDNRLLVDGGITESVPVSVARALGAGFVVAVDVGFCVRQGKMKNIVQIMIQAFQIMGEALNRYQSLQADVIIKPDLGDLDQLSFHRAEEAIVLGRRAAEQQLSYLEFKLKEFMEE